MSTLVIGAATHKYLGQGFAHVGVSFPSVHRPGFRVVVLKGTAHKKNNAGVNVGTHTLTRGEKEAAGPGIGGQ